MYVIIAGLRMRGYSLDTIFRELYWEDWWQIANAIGHSFLLWGGLAVASLIALRRQHVAEKHAASPHPIRAAYAQGGAWAMALAVSASALLHSLIDMACHRNDGHMHFWPLSNWRFVSPVSYWDPAHYGTAFSLFEATLGLLMAVLLFFRYKNSGVRLVLALLVIAYVAVPLFYVWTLSGHDHRPPQGGEVQPPPIV